MMTMTMNEIECFRRLLSIPVLLYNNYNYNYNYNNKSNRVVKTKRAGNEMTVIKNTTSIFHIFVLFVGLLLLATSNATASSSSFGHRNRDNKNHQHSTSSVRRQHNGGRLLWWSKNNTDQRGGGSVGIGSGGSGILNTIRESQKHLTAAAAARSVSIFGMYPMDTIKTRKQLQKPNPYQLSGLYGGLGGNLIGQIPYGVLTFGSYEMYKRSLLQRFPDLKEKQKSLIYALSALLGDLTGSLWVCPSEVVKQQMQAGMHKTTSQAIKSILHEKGIFGFYQGYLGGLARDVPFRVAQLTSYEIAKSIYLKAKEGKIRRRLQQGDIVVSGGGGENDDETTTTTTGLSTMLLELSPMESAICGAIAGTFSAAITSPLDRIKTLLMTNGEYYGGSVINCATRIISEEGITGLATGLLPRVLYIAPSVALFFMTYEVTQQRLKTWGSSH